MSFLNIQHVEIRGIAACVPSRVEENMDFKLLSREELEKNISITGIKRRHCAIHDGSVCTSDLCLKSAEKLLEELRWDKSEIGLLFFVSHSADYKLPSTACILQHRLGLSKECMAFDSPLGCSGFVYGLGVAASIVSHGTIKKALVLVGNTQSVFASPEDKSTALLFGDAGSALAIEYNPLENKPMEFHFMSDGSGAETLMVPDGGCRNPVSSDSFVMKEYGDGIRRSRLHEQMDGMSVFTFAITQVPQSLRALSDKFLLDNTCIDYLLLHQANKFLCEKIRKKMGYPVEKVPYNIHEYGNTSAATIPLLMVTELGEKLRERELDILMTGFGVGLSIGTAHVCMQNVVCPELLYI